MMTKPDLVRHGGNLVRITVRVCRAAKVKMDHLRASAGVDPRASSARTLEALMERYGPMAPTFRLLPPAPVPHDSQPSDENPFAIATMEAMSFDEICEPNQARCGQVEHEPLNSNEIHRLDGALESELGRIGIPAEAEYFQWRSWYEIR
jgi:hypothetical protein